MGVVKSIMKIIMSFLLGMLVTYSVVCFAELFMHAYDLIINGNICVKNIAAFLLLSLYMTIIMYIILEERRWDDGASVN